MEKIVIIDFGSQTCHLISRRIREFNVYTDIISPDKKFKDLDTENIKGFIFSGSPFSVNDKTAPVIDETFYHSNIPILGICYGFQRMTIDFGGNVGPDRNEEFGKVPITYTENSILYENIPAGFNSWMSHQESISTLGTGFKLIGRSPHHPAAAYNPDKKLYGIQYHPEVTHSEYGAQLLRNFALRICEVKQEWNIDTFFYSISQSLRNRVKKKNVLLLISGGVDSTVVAALLLKIFHTKQINLMYIDTGLMRKNETDEVRQALAGLGAENLYIIDASEEFLTALHGISDPEEKRLIIGDLFITIQEKEINKLKIKDSFLAQGTLYTDMIESGKGVGNNAQIIKSHHNVRSPLIEQKRAQGKVIEPLAALYKDEVRELGEFLNLPSQIVNRHPFPGPGLAIRIIGEITKEKCDILREADAIFLEELKKRNLYNQIWQAFAVLLSIKSVGVTGDSRKYGYVLALRGIVSKDGMTADVYPFILKDLLEISSRITNNVPQIGRVVYDITSKPPSTIEWE